MAFFLKRRAQITPPVLVPTLDERIEQARQDVMEADAEVAKISTQLGQLQQNYNLVLSPFGVIEHVELPDATQRSGIEGRVRELVHDYSKAMAQFHICLNVWAGLKGSRDVTGNCATVVRT